MEEGGRGARSKRGERITNFQATKIALLQEETKSWRRGDSSLCLMVVWVTLDEEEASPLEWFVIDRKGEGVFRPHVPLRVAEEWENGLTTTGFHEGGLGRLTRDQFRGGREIKRNDLPRSGEERRKNTPNRTPEKKEEERGFATSSAPSSAEMKDPDEERRQKKLGILRIRRSSGAEEARSQ